jgi:hypothetical protein
MESIMLTVKFVVMLAMEVFVIGTLGAALIAGIVQIVRDKVREVSLPQELAPKVQHTTR